MLVLVMSAFTVMTGFAGAGGELLGDSEDIEIGEIEEREPGHGTEVDIYDDAETEVSVLLNETIFENDIDDVNVTFYGNEMDEDAEERENVTVSHLDDDFWANHTWTELSYGTEYEWYVEIWNTTEEENHVLLNESAVWTFTTKYYPITIEMNEPEDEVDIYPDREVELNVSVTHPDGEGNILNVTFYGDGDRIDNTTVESGENATMTWDELDYQTEYEWYVHVHEEGEPNHVNESETWTFSTNEIITEREPAHEADDVQLNPELNVTVEHPNDADLNVTFFGNEIDEDLDELYNETVVSGEYVTYVWEDLDFNTTYEWYVLVEENQTDEELAESDVWNFTTRDADMFDLELDITGEGNVTVEWYDGEYEVSHDETPMTIEDINETAEVYLNATAAEGYVFHNWTGDYEDDDTDIMFEMDEGKDITANFVEERTLTIHSEEGGNVTEPGEGNFTYADGETVNLEAEADTGYEFVEWTGENETIDNTSAAETTILMDDDYEITATFEDVVVVDTHDLTIDIEGEGNVTVAWNDEEHEIEEETTFTIEEGTEVTLTADPAEDWYFEQWTGDYESADDEISFDIDDDMDITAHFTETVHELTVEVEGDGTVTVGWLDAEETVTDEDTFTIPDGIEVTLTAEADEDWEFVEWTGDHESEEDEISFDIEEDMEITAHFEEEEVEEEMDIMMIVGIIVIIVIILAIIGYMMKSGPEEAGPVMEEEEEEELFEEEEEELFEEEEEEEEMFEEEEEEEMFGEEEEEFGEEEEEEMFGEEEEEFGEEEDLFEDEEEEL